LYLYGNYNKCEKAREEADNAASHFGDFMYRKGKNKKWKCNIE